MMKCVNCDADMKKKSIMNSGNAKYETYFCENCGNQDAKCIGVLNDA